MKKVLHSIGIATIIMLIALGTYAFKKYQQAKTAADVFRGILYNGLYTQGYGETVWADSTMNIRIPASWDSTQVITKGPLSLCGNSPAYFYYYMRSGLGDKEGDVALDATTVKNFKTVFGKDLLGAPTLMAAKNYDGKRTSMNRFKADALKTAFDQLYKSPEDNFDGFAMQHLYDIMVKDYFRACGNVVADVMQHKDQFQKEATTYEKQAKTDAKFDGAVAGFDACERLLGKDYAEKNECLNGVADRIVGMMIRRQIDGTLPTLLDCAKKVLRDYDPTYYNTIQTKF